MTTAALPNRHEPGDRKAISVLASSTFAFTICFAVWMIYAVLGVAIKKQLGLSETEFGLLAAMPVLSGSLVRVPLGIWTDRFGGRIVMFVLMLSTVIPIWMIQYATAYWHFLVLGLFVGLAGGAFSVGTPYVARWFRPERQGLAMGVFGAGNSGAALNKFAAPALIAAAGSWAIVPRVYAIAMLVTAIIFWLFSSSNPDHYRESNGTFGNQLKLLKDPKVLRYCQYYSVVFGGYVGLSLWMTKYYVEEYGFTLQLAALLAACFSLPGGVLRALGGWMSDKFGAYRTTWWVMWVCWVAFFILSYPQTDVIVRGVHGPQSFHLGLSATLFTVVLFTVGVAMAVGKASVFKFLSDDYGDKIGAVSGIVGLFGGLGGFLLPILFGAIEDLTGVRTSCFMLLYGTVCVALVWMHYKFRVEAVEEGRRAIEEAKMLHHWEPENPTFWQAVGERVAYRNLFISIPALMLAFAIWMMWSVVVVNLDKAGFNFTKNQLFWLTALPALSGATLRIFYSFLVPIFGGRRWTAISTASLLIPAVGMGFALRDPSTSYPTLFTLALLCGLGGGNFSSSMANISFFFPKAKKGLATGLNAGIGNLGVSLVQLVTPFIVSTAVFGALAGDGVSYMKAGVAKTIWLQNAGFIWVPFIIASAVAAWFGMNDIADARASFAEQAVIFKRKHNWLMCVLYTGTFGSFIGFSAGLPMLTKTLFPGVNPAQYAFLGPLVGALARPIGGWLSDKVGGARVTFWTFILMGFSVLGLMHYLPNGGVGSFAGFLAMFIVLFALTGIGNGSTFRMIPVIFLTERQREAAKDEGAQKQALLDANKEAAAVLGFAGALGAYGGFFIPKSFGTSLELTGGPQAALYCFIGFYAACMAITWWFYSRKQAEVHC